jgi:predicted dehydrogenase
MNNKVKWGILGTGNIAHIFAKAISESTTCELYAIGSRSEEKANSFASTYNLTKIYSSYVSLLSDPDIHAIYIALPHALHAEWAIKAAQAKKHILCEKPITINYKEAISVIEAANQNNVFIMEAFVFRSHPQTDKLRELIRNRHIGDVRIITATFSFKSEINKKFDKLILKKLGGGAILDVGCYPISMTRLIVGEVSAINPSEPVNIIGLSHLNKEGMDEYSICCIEFSNGILAQVSCGISVDQKNEVKIFGSEGVISIQSPWIPGGRNAATTKIILQKYNSNDPEIFYTETKFSSSTLMIDNFVRHMADTNLWTYHANESLANMKTLDRWRDSAGVIY